MTIQVAPITDEELARLEAKCERPLRPGCIAHWRDTFLATIARIRAAEARSETAERGSFMCPLGCSIDGVHHHHEVDLRAYASNTLARFGYRVELISPIAYAPVREDVDGILYCLREYTHDACDPLGGEGRPIRRAVATIERLVSDVTVERERAERAEAEARAERDESDALRDELSCHDDTKADLAAMTERASTDEDCELLFSTRERLKREQLSGESFAVVVDRLVRERNAARADVERLREMLGRACTEGHAAPSHCGSCHSTIVRCDSLHEGEPLRCMGSPARALLAETAPNGPHADT